MNLFHASRKVGHCCTRCADIVPTPLLPPAQAESWIDSYEYSHYNEYSKEERTKMNFLAACFVFAWQRWSGCFLKIALFCSSHRWFCFCLGQNLVQNLQPHITSVIGTTPRLIRSRLRLSSTAKKKKNQIICNPKEKPKDSTHLVKTFVTAKNCGLAKTSKHLFGLKPGKVSL